MLDRELRELRREEETGEAELLHRRLRSGELPLERLELAAFLGHGPALEVLDAEPGPPPLQRFGAWLAEALIPGAKGFSTLPFAESLARFGPEVEARAALAAAAWGWSHLGGDRAARQEQLLRASAGFMDDRSSPLLSTEEALLAGLQRVLDPSGIYAERAQALGELVLLSADMMLLVSDGGLELSEAMRAVGNAALAACGQPATVGSSTSQDQLVPALRMTLFHAAKAHPEASAEGARHAVADALIPWALGEPDPLRPVLRRLQRQLGVE